jgi:uncharacterized membrane protein YkvA (DUF1232 family)
MNFMTRHKENKDTSHFSFKLAMAKAQELIKSKEQVYRLSREAVHKAGNHQTSLAKVWSDFLSLIEMLRQWSQGAYPHVPVGTLLLSLAALVYFINPLDAIPDPIPFAGYIDDSMIIGLVLTAIKSDLNHFQRWKMNTKQTKEKINSKSEGDSDTE